ncbi:MAG: Mrp/NBP35 family ATP-binding protein [Thermoguttaceae bacterium]|jgi:ATP-binding protein involved in chromosome partitioning
MTTEPVTEAALRQAIAAFQDPETGRSALQLGQIHQLELSGEDLSVTLGLTTWSAVLREEIRSELLSLLKKQFPQLNISVNLAVHERRPEKIGEIGLTAKSVIAVGAGKGGVGKSSVAAYLAYGFARAGCRVGLLDADVYGPSIPHLLGTNNRPMIVGNHIQPVELDGLKVMSMGFLVPPGEAVIWRGPMLHSALTQFLRDTQWGDLDYLIIDLPPGTGDVALSLAQLLPLIGAVIVGTPQDLALLDVVKAIGMFRKVDIEVLGMIENMSFFVCPQCGARHDIFSSGGAKKKAEQLHVPFLGEVPIVTELRILADRGQIGKAFENETAKPYLESICLNLARRLVRLHRNEPQLPTLTVLK